jgi:hypothetical protein
MQERSALCQIETSQVQILTCLNRLYQERSTTFPACDCHQNPFGVSAHFILFHSGICHNPHIVMNIEIEQGTRLSSRFVYDKIVERVVLAMSCKR